MLGFFAMHSARDEALTSTIYHVSDKVQLCDTPAYLLLLDFHGAWYSTGTKAPPTLRVLPLQRQHAQRKWLLLSQEMGRY
mmetsp:Transcript_48105/g.125110  ORF Transcript_48105/g.125110 Transcript_48105/m.125110 type:complete len:80 (+) Transcript_48105:1589-1828(+)